MATAARGGRGVARGGHSTVNNLYSLAHWRPPQFRMAFAIEAGRFSHKARISIFQRTVLYQHGRQTLDSSLICKQYVCLSDSTLRHSNIKLWCAAHGSRPLVSCTVLQELVVARVRRIFHGRGVRQVLATCCFDSVCMRSNVCTCTLHRIHSCVAIIICRCRHSPSALNMKQKDLWTRRHAGSVSQSIACFTVDHTGYICI